MCTRDVHKLLATKQYYNKSNAAILADPVLHRLAILQGIQSEQVSHLVEDIVAATTPHHVATSKQRDAISALWYKKYPPMPVSYQAEEQVNARLGIALCDLLMVTATASIALHGCDLNAMAD